MWLTNASVYDVRTGKYRRQDLQVDKGRIAGLAAKAPRHDAAVDLDGAFLLPGFFDCHVHICVDTRAKSVASLWQGALPGTIALFAASAARKMLLCGITTARDVGGWDYHEIAVREAINSGLIEGSRLFCAGKILSMTSASTPMWRGMYEECDGPAEVRKAARKQLAMGANFIKLLATGAVNSSKYERADTIQLRADEITAAVEIANDNLSYVAAHAHALPGIRNAVECGCRTVEHGTFGNESVFKLMAKKDCWLVPTSCTATAFLDDEKVASEQPAHIEARYRQLHERKMAMLRLAAKAGVKVAMGTDMGTVGNHPGDNMRELEVMVQSRAFSPRAAIASATLEAAKMMRLEQDLGTLEVGRIADVIAVSEDPLKDITALRQKLFFVMKQGQVYRNDRISG